jgi:hypothetical protein
MKEDSRVTAGYTITMADYKNGCPLEKIRATLKRSEQNEQYELCQGIQRAIEEITNAEKSKNVKVDIYV